VLMDYIIIISSLLRMKAAHKNTKNTKYKNKTKNAHNFNLYTARPEDQVVWRYKGCDGVNSLKSDCEGKEVV